MQLQLKAMIIFALEVSSKHAMTKTCGEQFLQICDTYTWFHQLVHGTVFTSFIYLFIFLGGRGYSNLMRKYFKKYLAYKRFFSTVCLFRTKLPCFHYSLSRQILLRKSKVIFGRSQCYWHTLQCIKPYWLYAWIKCCFVEVLLICFTEISRVVVYSKTSFSNLCAYLFKIEASTGV